MTREESIRWCKRMWKFIKENYKEEGSVWQLKKDFIIANAEESRCIDIYNECFFCQFALDSGFDTYTPNDEESCNNVCPLKDYIKQEDLELLLCEQVGVSWGGNPLEFAKIIEGMKELEETKDAKV